MTKTLIRNQTATHDVYSRENVSRRIEAANATLNIGGDLLVDAATQYAGYTQVYPTVTTLYEIRTMGVNGNAGTVVNLGGSYKTTMRCMSSGYSALTLSTVNALGGTESTPETWEVTADPTGTSFAAGTGAIGTLNIGASGDPACYGLVNDNVNDNDPANVAKVKDGELLLASKLSIANGTLDLNGLGVKLAAGASALAIAPGSWLDLDTGLPLAVGDRVTTFVGLGDQTATWSAVKGSVTDSSVAGALFKPIVHTDGNTYWVRAPASGTTLVVR